MPDLIIQGPNSKTVAIESVNEVVEYLLQVLLVPNSVQNSASKAEQKKPKNANLAREANTTQQLYDSVTKVKLSSRKKKTKSLAQGCPTNGYYSSNNEELEGNGYLKDISEVIYEWEIVGL